MKKTDEFNKLERLFTSEWAELVGFLLAGNIRSLLKRWGIEVTDTTERRYGQRNGVNYEFGITAIGENELVIVEVRTTLIPEDIRHFVKKLTQAKVWMPEYADKRILGAVAFLSEDTGASAMAESKGLFVSRATGDSASIINDDNFTPKAW